MKSKYSTFQWISDITVLVLIILSKAVLYYHFYTETESIGGYITMILLGEVLYCLVLCMILDEFENEPGEILLPLTSVIFIVVAAIALIISKLSR